MFSGCTNLTDITIPSSVTKIGERAFSGCTSLTKVTLPDYVTTIGSGAFTGCTSLAGITIPKFVTTIEDYVFEDCTGLTSVTIPDGVTEIGYNAFKDCKGLTSITIPDGVTEIGNNAFENCTGLTSITIPSQVVSIEYGAFFGIYDLMTIYSLNPTPPYISSSSIFYYTIYDEATLYVPYGSLDAYRNANDWSKFVNIREFDPTGIAGVEVDGGMDVSVEAGNVVVSGTAAPVAVYSLAGALVGTGDGGERTVIAVPGAGVYVVKAGGRAVKVMVK